MLGTTGYIKSLCIAGYPDKYNESNFMPGNESLEPTYSILPNAYKVLDYIELTGTQYINTEVYMSNKK